MAKDIDDKLSYIQQKIDDVADCVNKIDKDVVLHKSAFDEHLKQDERMYEEFKRMNDILQQNTDSLKEHMHRTELLEELVQKMDLRLTPIEKQNIQEKAIESYRHEVIMKFAKFIGLLVGIASAVAALWPLISK